MLPFYCSLNTIFLFDKRTQNYTYETSPPFLKEALLEFEQSAKQYNVDVSKIRKIKFVLTTTPNLSFGGYSSTYTHTIYLNLVFGFNKSILWHELGHQILNYGHDLRDETKHIMNSGRSKFLYSSWDEQKRSFFQEPIPRNYIQNIAKNFTVNNYLKDDMVENFTTIKTFVSKKFLTFKNKALLLTSQSN